MAINVSLLKDFYSRMVITETTAATPTLYTKAKTGKIRIWTGFICVPKNVDSFREDLLPLSSDFDETRANRKETAVTYTVYQQEGGKKLTYSKPTIVADGKNIGKKNETTPFLQALQKLLTDFTKKVKKGAKTAAEDLNEKTFDQLVAEGRHRVNVMLLQDVNKNHWNKVKYPCFIQPKLDGVHMVSIFLPPSSLREDVNERNMNVNIKNDKTGIDLYLRGITKKIGQYHIREALQPVLSQNKWHGFYVTGEMFTPGLNRQTITSAVMSEDSTEKIIFNVFDIFNIDKPLPFNERYKLAVELVREVQSPYVKIVKAKLVHSREEIDKAFEDYIKKGYEGAVLRAYDGLYEFGLSREIRSFNAMKLKKRDDFEFEICGFKQGIGKNKGLIIFIAKTSQKFIDSFLQSKNESDEKRVCSIKEFAVSPSWTEEERKKKYLIGDTFIGRMATISFDSISDECIPVQPVLIMIH